MIDSYTATFILIGFLVIFGICLPIADKIPKIKNFVSLRWMLVIVYSSLCIGVILDFEHLDNSVRFAVVVGGIVLSSLFVLARSIEKAFFNNWSLPHTRASIAKGDIKADFSVNSKITDEKQSLSSKKVSDDDQKKKQEALSQYIKDKEEESDEKFDEVMNKCLLFTDVDEKENVKKH